MLDLLLVSPAPPIKAKNCARWRTGENTQSVLYCFCETRVALLGLLTLTEFSGHAVTFRSPSTVFADTLISGLTSTRILSGKPARAMWSAAMFLGLYRIRTSLTARIVRWRKKENALAITGFQSDPTDTRIARGALWFPPRRVSVEPRCIRLRFRVAPWAKEDGRTSLNCSASGTCPPQHLLTATMLDEPQTVYVGLIGLGLL